MNKETMTIDMTPTWAQILPLMMTCIENGDLSAESRVELHIEFERMAQAADKFNAMQKDNADAIAKVTS